MSVQLGEWRDGDLYIEGLKYEFPKKPAKKDFINYGLPKSHQLWNRSLEYQKYDWSSGWQSRLNDNPEQSNYLIEEITRILDGVWILIDGEEVYLNGDTYFFVSWYLLEEGTYPDFRDSVLYYYRFIEICDLAPLCTGHTLLKARRVGATAMTLSRLQRQLLITHDSNFGIVSNKGKNASKAFQRVVKSMGNLPVFLRPTQEGNTAPKQVLSLKEQSQRITKTKQHGESQSGLNNELSWENTDLNSYDSYALKGLLLDECLSPETKIMMSDGKFKEVDLINVGDYVMVEGGIPKKVVKRFDGYDNMYTIKQPYGKDYKVNSKHRLYLEHRMGGGNKTDGLYKITPEEYFTKFTKSSYRVISRVTSSGIEFPKKDLPLDPYFLGMWLGDGLGDHMGFVVNYKEDPEILEYLKDYAKKNKCGISINDIKYCKSVKRVNIKKNNGSTHINNHVTILKNLNILDNKHIPNIYLTTSIEDRLQLLAGVIDTDGHNPKNYKTRLPKGAFEIAMSRKDLIEQIQYLARSCGFSVSNIVHKKSNFDSDVYKISISGDLSKIPTKVKRKQYVNYVKSYASRRNKMYIEPTPEAGRYVGIQVEADNDDERRLILEDFTITLNCGKYPKDVPFSKYLPVVTKCLKRGARVVGKLMAPTTCNPPADGGSEYQEVWSNSDQNKMSSLGQTGTGLYRIFIPAYIGFEGFILPSGRSVISNPTPEEQEALKKLGCPNPTVGAKDFLEDTRKQKENNPEDLQEEIRMNPFSPKEVFDTANNRCLFDIDNLNKREQELSEQLLDMGKNPNKDELGRRGWFNKSPNGRVEFVDDPKGIWYAHILLSHEESNKFEIRGNGEKVPLNEELGAGGFDPIFSSDATVDLGSLSCCIIRNRFSSMSPHNTGIPMAMALGRMDDVDKHNEQIFNGLQYYGVKMLAERAPINYITYAKREKLTGYLYGTQRSDGTWIYGIVSQQTLAVKDEHAEVQVLSSLHDHDKIPFIGLIRNRKGFDVNDRGDWDICMADGYALMALRMPFKKAKPPKPQLRYLPKGRIL